MSLDKIKTKLKEYIDEDYTQREGWEIATFGLGMVVLGGFMDVTAIIMVGCVVTGAGLAIRWFAEE